MPEKGISPESIKFYIESQLTGLHGSVNSIEIDEVKSNENDFDIKGTFRVPFGKKYSFEMSLNQENILTSYKRNEITDIGYA